MLYTRLPREPAKKVLRPEYERIVMEIERGEIEVSDHYRRVDVPTEYEDHVYVVVARRTASGLLVVKFYLGAGFPAKHSGYMYVSGAAEPPNEPDTVVSSRLAQHWFAIYD